MAWTEDDLRQIESAIKQGVTSVKYSDKTVTYRSLEEMLRIRDLIRKDLCQGGSGGRLYASYSKGLNGK